ncbi:MAG TPA: prolyl oligopeptidase family serine peptidase, partial [Chthoniobacterales bacterium]|nr:prolyl oligopeptidase family serine peptidase [Chthoniobacterales bacterium]
MVLDRSAPGRDNRLWSRQSDESWDVDCGLCRYFKELGLPLRFPGTETSYGILYQITSAEILARATTWAGQSETARNEIFNITNGDYFRWKYLWPRIATMFDMPAADPIPTPLTVYMADKKPVWEAIVRKHRLQPIPYEQVSSWPFADAILRLMEYEQQLDLFVPTNRKNMPLIVYVHGGGYGHGDKFVSCAVDLFGPTDFTAPEMEGDGGAHALFGGTAKEHMGLARSASPIYYIHPDQPPIMVIHGTADHLVPFLQSERFVDAVEKAGAPFYFHTVVGAGHNPYFGLNFNSSRTNFEGSGGGTGLFEDPLVEPLIFAFFRHYLLEGKKDLFTGEGVS